MRRSKRQQPDARLAAGLPPRAARSIRAASWLRAAIEPAELFERKPILPVDPAGRLVREGYTVNDAVAAAGRRRLRPILMTTSTTLLALIPLALGVGEGADAQAPLARTVAGGLAASTTITLALIPVVYVLIRRRKAKPAAAARASAH